MMFFALMAIAGRAPVIPPDPEEPEDDPNIVALLIALGVLS